MIQRAIEVYNRLRPIVENYAKHTLSKNARLMLQRCRQR